GGGDVHYVSSCAAGALTRMMIADVSGHGEAVSETARRLRKLMQRHVNHHQQTRFVRMLNAEFAELAQNGRFATAVAFTFDAPIEASIGVGDLVLCYTDALIEARKRSELLGEAGLLQFVRKLDTTAAERFARGLISAIQADGWEIDDDTTVFLFRPHTSRFKV